MPLPDMTDRRPGSNLAMGTLRPRHRPALLPPRAPRPPPGRDRLARTAGDAGYRSASEGRVDLGGQEVEVELVGVVRIEAGGSRVVPTRCERLVGERGHDDGSACRLLVELDGGGEHVCGERGPDPEARVAVVDCEPAEQQRRDGIGRAFGEHLWAAERSMPVIATLAYATTTSLASAITQVAAVSRRRFWPA